MAKIKDIYSNYEYEPFLSACQERGLKEMADLRRFPFHTLCVETELSSMTRSKIKMIFVAYCKAHPAEFFSGKSAERGSARAAAAAKEQDGATERVLEAYFQENADKLIRLADLSKTIGKKQKRSDLIRILEEAPWCKVVDGTTFFYCPQAQK